MRGGVRVQIEVRTGADTGIYIGTYTETGTYTVKGTDICVDA